MNCVKCGRRAGYNRAVVDVTSGVLLGGFCVDCEESAFGESLRQGFWRGADGCGLCPRDGHVALPRWTASAEERGGDVHSSVDYQITDGTLLVCDEHLALVRDDDVSTPSVTAPSGPDPRQGGTATARKSSRPSRRNQKD